MEGSDAFGTPVSEGDDPFAGGEDWAGFGEPNGEGAAPEATAELPTVDKEGNAVEASTSSDTRSELERQEDAYQYKTQRGEPVTEELRDAHLEFERQRAQATDDEEFEAAAPEPEPAEDTARAAEVAPDPNDQLRAVSEREAAAKAAEANEQRAVTDAQEAADAAARAVDDVQAAEAERETAEGAQEAPEQVAAPEEAAEAPEQVAPEEAAEAPDERESPGGKKTHRRYYVLQNTGPGEFKQVSWYEDANGKMVAKGTPGAKRQGVALCRGTEDALRIGHAALGSPDTAVKLVAVAALHFQARTLEPDVPEPRRTRLKIS